MDLIKTVAIIGLMGVILIFATATYFYSQNIKGNQNLQRRFEILAESNGFILYIGCQIAVFIVLLLLMLTIIFVYYLVR